MTAACCLLEAPLTSRQAEMLASQLKALADPVRLRLLSMIATAPTGDVCACEFPEALGKSQPTVSHHLSQLVDAGLLTREQRGKWAWFQLAPEVLTTIRVALGEGADHHHVAKPSVLFLCTRNADRSQIAAAFMRAISGDSVDVESAGSAPADSINPIAVEAMTELDIDISGAQPQRWNDDMARAADLIITMGGGDECPIYPGKRHLNWELDDPTGEGFETMRRVRDDIRQLVTDLAAELTPACCG